MQEATQLIGPLPAQRALPLLFSLNIPATYFYLACLISSHLICYRHFYSIGEFILGLCDIRGNCSTWGKPTVNVQTPHR